MKGYVGRAFDLQEGRILRVLGRLRGSAPTASTDAAFADLASRVLRLLCQETIAAGRNMEHADTAQPVSYAVIISDTTDFAAPAPTGPPFAKGKPGPNRIEEHRRFAKHAKRVFGADLPTLPAKCFPDFAKALDADPGIIPPPSYDTFAAYLAPKMREGANRKAEILARQTREKEVRRLIKNRLKRLPAAELRALMNPPVMERTS
jgi:hypothetical protein